jgi:magnesium chelatase subunit H
MMWTNETTNYPASSSHSQNVGAVGTAALLDVPRSLEALLDRLMQEGYDVGDWGQRQDNEQTNASPSSRGESLVAALAVLCENTVINAGANRMQDAVDAKIKRAQRGDKAVAAALANGLGGGAQVAAQDISLDELEMLLGSYMTKKVRRAWKETEIGPGVSADNKLVVAGLQLGNIWIFVQPLLGVEGDPMRMLFERDLTPHPQYCAVYRHLTAQREDGGLGAQAVIHLG